MPVPVVGAFRVANAAPDVVRVIASPLGSTATTFTTVVEPTFKLTLGMFDRIGAWASAAETGRSRRSAPRANTLDANFIETLLGPRVVGQRGPAISSGSFPPRRAGARAVNMFAVPKRGTGDERPYAQLRSRREWAGGPRRGSRRGSPRERGRPDPSPDRSRW